MRWFKPSLISSIHALFTSSHPPAAAEEESEFGVEDIRESMLDLIAGVDDPHSAHVTRRIRYAGDAQALWFLRGDLMAVLAHSHGETAARTKIEAISAMFAGVLPQGLRSRPSPLSGMTTRD